MALAEQQESSDGFPRNAAPLRERKLPGRADLPHGDMDTGAVHRGDGATGVSAGSSAGSRRRRAPFGAIGAGCCQNVLLLLNEWPVGGDKGGDNIHSIAGTWRNTEGHYCHEDEKQNKTGTHGRNYYM